MKGIFRFSKRDLIDVSWVQFSCNMLRPLRSHDMENCRYGKRTLPRRELLLVNARKQRVLLETEIEKMIYIWDKLKKLTIAKAETRDEIIFVERSQRLADYKNRLFIWIRSFAERVQTFSIERSFPWNRTITTFLFFTFKIYVNLPISCSIYWSYQSTRCSLWNQLREWDWMIQDQLLLELLIPFKTPFTNTQ